MKKFLAKNKSYLVLFLAIIAVLTGILVLLRLESVANSDEVQINLNGSSNESEEGELSENKATIMVDISGEVKKPGVYEFAEGQIINDAIEAAGGFTKNADQDYVNKNINKAEKLTDQQKIYIPARNEQENSIEGVVTEESQDISGKVNINSASLSELDSLPGIGPSYAQRIIDARPFSKIEDIKNISGIGDATFEKIKDLISI
jgi:competence protein ComEA